MGGNIELSLWRDGRSLTIDIELRPAPEAPPRNLTELEGSHPIAGATVGNLYPAFAEELGTDTLARGVVIIRIVQGSPAHRLRLRPGDVLLSINGQRIDTVGDLQEALRGTRGEWRIGLRRGDRKVNLVVRT